MTGIWTSHLLASSALPFGSVILCSDGTALREGGLGRLQDDLSGAIRVVAGPREQLRGSIAWNVTAYRYVRRKNNLKGHASSPGRRNIKKKVDN